MDNSLILKEARKYIKDSKNCKKNIKIAVLGTESVQYFVMVLKYLLSKEGIYADIYEGDYDGITMNVYDDNSEFYMFQPNITIIIPSYREFKESPNILEEYSETEALVENGVKFYTNMFAKINANLDTHIIVSNVVIPPEHPLGNLECQTHYSQNRFLNAINEKLVQEKEKNVSVVDLEELASCIGKYSWFDYASFFLTKQPYKIDYVGQVAEKFVKQILALKGNIRKCLVLDLDNTIWGGVVGDEGYEGIQLDPNNAIGEAYRHFQEYVVKLRRRGIIIAVCSKNDENTAKEPFIKNKNMILKLDDIACFKANWNDKATNLKEISKELNIGMDSLVFFDDNPAEREIVTRFLPEVYVVDVPKDPAQYVRELDQQSPFEWLQITKEDLLRTNSYVENAKRVKLENQFVDYDDYLRALDMCGTSRCIHKCEVPRFTQLLNKSNQFNLRTRRYSEDDIYKMLSDDNYACIMTQLDDKFSEYGIIGCAIIRKQGTTCYVDSWVMSCRVLKRGVEFLTYQTIVEQAADWGCDGIEAEYIKTKKNAMVSNFYDNLGFIITGQDIEKTEYAIDLRDVSIPRFYIRRTEDDGC